MRYTNTPTRMFHIGLDVEQIDDRRLCCGIPPGSGREHMCSFIDWSCSGICRSVNSITVWWFTRGVGKTRLWCGMHLFDTMFIHV
ncbi:hypothetical protein HanRHA438_Chr04g0182441 [Helianthus annuus]|nr:hypothetical protein HanRHA438_Chr04g0182441 [Helianthus annuus]